MAGRDPRESRILGLWTAGWLAVMLVAGLLWIGDLSVQWPGVLVPLPGALLAPRPRPGAARQPRTACRPGHPHRHRGRTGRVGPVARRRPAQLIALGECARFCR